MDKIDEGVGKIKGPLPIPGAEIPEEMLKGIGSDSGLSSIEKSKTVRPEIVPLMSFPVLSVPAEVGSMAFAVATVDASGHSVTTTLMRIASEGEEVKNSVLKGWSDNLKEIEEYVRQILTSPLYIQLQEIRQKGDPQSGSVSGVQGAASANAGAQAEPVAFLSSLQQLQVLNRVPPSAEIPEPSAPEDSAQVLILPLAASMLAGAGLALGTELVHASNPLGGIFELVQQIQPMFPQVAVQDLVPIINLMVVAPIYFNSWKEAVSNIKSGERNSYVQTAQNFAKDVIKIVTDPSFVQNTLVSRMRGTEKLSPLDQERLSRMLKIVLIGVALSLLYTVDVGKVQAGKFGGIEPEELRDLILGKWTQPNVPGKKMNLQEQLTASLIKRIQEQMAPLSKEDREIAANMLLEYITKPRELDPMLDPAKVFDETLASTLFDPTKKSDLFKA